MAPCSDSHFAALTVAWEGGALTLEFADGAVGARWAAKIRNPPSRLDKLGVKEGTRVALVSAKGELGGDADVAGFVAELGARGAKLVKGAKTMADADLMFLVVDVKVASFSDTRTAEKFVVPVDERGKKAAARR